MGISSLHTTHALMSLHVVLRHEGLPPTLAAPYFMRALCNNCPADAAFPDGLKTNADTLAYFQKK